MGRMSDRHIELQEEAADELLCEINHYKARLAEAKHSIRTIELCVDGLNTKGYPQKKNTQAALDNIKRHARAFLEGK